MTAISRLRMSADEYLVREAGAEEKSILWDGEIYAMAGALPESGLPSGRGDRVHAIMGVHSDVPCRLLGCRFCVASNDGEPRGAAAMIPTDPEVIFYDDPYDPDDWFHYFVDGMSGERVEMVAMVAAAPAAPWRERRSSARRNDLGGYPAVSRDVAARRRGPGRRWEDRAAAAAMMF